MRISVIDEYNEDGHLMWTDTCIGAYARGKTREDALSKFDAEIRQYTAWLGRNMGDEPVDAVITEEKRSALQVCDADSDVLFLSERLPLTREEYERQKALACKSAADFLTMYRSVPDKTGTVLTPRETFYGPAPITAEDMYLHTKSVNNYYFAEICVDAVNEPDILACREAAFSALEQQNGFLDNRVFDGSYGEKWSLRKVLRRFIWHDRIHAKAMYRMTVRLCGDVANPFCFL